jgi:DNA adenine methylase
MKSPYPYFGGKSRVADLVWSRLGNVPNYVEPFFGSGAVLLARQHPPKVETVNDMDAYLTNFWRALAADPDGVAEWADNPVNELDLHARHRWIRAQSTEKMRADPDFYDVKIAGWWVWGISCWIGDNWVKENTTISVPGLGSRVGICRDSLSLSRPHLGRDQGTHAKFRSDGIYEYLRQLSERVRRVRVCCGDWSRVVTDSATIFHGITGVFLDPPYFSPDRGDVYNHDSRELPKLVEVWAREKGSDERYRIVICGYEGDYPSLDGWECIPWEAGGMYRKNAGKERLWFSPGCLPPEQPGLFDSLPDSDQEP